MDFSMAQRKYTHKKLIKIGEDDINIRSTIRTTLLQTQEILSLKENEIASEDMFNTKIKSYENFLSTLRTIIEDVTVPTNNKEHLLRIAKIDDDIIDRIIEFNVKLMAIANEIYTQAKSDADIMVIKQKTGELRDMFAEKQKLFLVEKIR